MTFLSSTACLLASTPRDYLYSRFISLRNINISSMGEAHTKDTIMTRPSKEKIKEVMEQVEALDLPDGAHWALIHELLELDYGDVFDLLAEDHEYFGYSG